MGNYFVGVFIFMTFMVVVAFFVWWNAVSEKAWKQFFRIFEICAAVLVLCFLICAIFE